jgi:serine/threonine protein kinase
MSKPSWIGKSLSGRYQIEEMIGQGGMSAVYKATDPNLKRVVAVKMIHSHLSDDPDFVKRFEEEAAAVAQLRHPNIIQVFDFNHDDESDSYYMVLEFVPGETLQQHLARLNASGRKLSITKALESMIDICEAVNYAHQRGMIHRDIKPANLMLTVTGQTILMDFGIAKIVGGQRHTATGAVVGTAMYMSPEQIKGEHPDRRSDIYSLGVTLFEMVSGRPPFEADSAMTLMMMHVNDPVPDPRTLNPDVPDDLVTVIDKALAKDPNDRYQTAAQMAAALRNVLGRIKAGASLETPAPPGATMVETPDMPPVGKPGATVVEGPDVSFESPGGTYVEPLSTPAEKVPGTRAETTPPPPRATGSVAGTGGVGGGGTASGGTAAGAVPTPRAPAKAAPTKILGLSLPLIAGAALVMVCLLGGGIYMVSRLFASAGASPLLAPTAMETPTVTVVVDTPLPSATLTPEITSTPTETPLPSATPTATVPPGIPFARINSITIDDQNHYVVEYETFEFTEKLPGMHVHFFFNTVSPENAGVPGSGPWILYGGPRPFTKYRVSDRPAQATQMCILVANPNHSVQPNSGNCVDLPDAP